MSIRFSPYTVVVGSYGSGKTELSLALARHIRRTSLESVVLVDLDIVNPYFRSAEQADLLQKEGIEVIMPTFALTAVDVPALPAQVQSIFSPERSGYVIIDVGGNEVGATALGRYADAINNVRDRLQTLYVINPYRPLSGTLEDISALYSLISARARLRPDMLVNNANLQRQTTARDLIDAQALLESVGAALGLPVGMVTGYEKLRDALPLAMREVFFPLSPLLLPEWLEDDTV